MNIDSCLKFMAIKSEYLYNECNGCRLIVVIPCLRSLTFLNIMCKALTVDFGEVKAAPTECKEKCFQLTSSAHLHYSKATQNALLMLMIL